MILVVAH